MSRVLYGVYAVLVLALLGAAEYRGWGLMRRAEAQTAPRTVRDNPGAYRPIYVGGSRYYRGK